jgi:energy-coupling factor transporter ATP-binding protein EcfA2
MTKSLFSATLLPAATLLLLPPSVIYCCAVDALVNYCKRQRNSNKRTNKRMNTYQAKVQANEKRQWFPREQSKGKKGRSKMF